MSNCCIPYKQLNNIDGSSQVTFNGVTSFDGIDELEAIDIVCDNLSASTIESGTITASIIYSTDIQTDTLEANTATITTINSVHINNTEDINTDTLNSVHINNAEDINTDTLKAITSVTAANIEIVHDTITTIDDEGNININIGAGNGNITLNTFDNGTAGVSKGSIELNVYGKGNISLTPTKSGVAGQEATGVVNIGTLEFSVDSTDNSIVKQTTKDKNLSINANGSGSVNIENVSINDVSIASITKDSGLNINANGSGSVNIESISINGSSITSSADHIDINKPVRLHDGSDYISFLPQSGVQQVYTWPSPPENGISPIYMWPSHPFGVPSIIPVIFEVGPYLTYDSDGALKWDSYTNLLMALGGYTIPSYLTTSINPFSYGKLLWSEPKEIPLQIEPFPAFSTYYLDPYLTWATNGDSFELSWVSKYIVTILPIPILDLEGNITIDGKQYKIPSLKEKV